MKPKKLPSLLIASAAFATAFSVLSAQETVIFSGNDLAQNFAGGTSSTSLNTTHFSTGPSSVALNYSAAFNSIGFSPVSTDQYLVYNSVDWSDPDTHFSFDYMVPTTGGITSLSRFRLHYLTAGGVDAITLEKTTGLALTVDGQWHTLTVVATGADWNSAYYTQVSGGNLDPDAPLRPRFSIQGGSAGIIYLDNIRIGTPSAVPEPSSFALLAAAGAGVMAVTRRRRRA